MNFLRLYIFLQVVLSHYSTLAQNLVPNGSFEDYGHCPGSYSLSPNAFDVNGWRSISNGSPDYFHTCSDGEAGIPYNWAGVSEAFEGFGYTGIYTWMNLDKDYREYLHGKLSEPLVRDSLYQIQFHYKLSSYSKFSIDRIGVLVSDSLKALAHDRTLNLKPTFSFVQDSALTKNTGTWEMAYAEYRAKGNELYITIGNFSDNTETKSYHIRFRPESEPMLAQSAYYYIDAVSIVPKYPKVRPEELADPDFHNGDLALDTHYVLKDVQFEFNSDVLLPVSFGDLDQLVTYLKEYSGIQITLSGHTDSIGGRNYNQALSTRRAQSVAAYLQAKGIHPTRIMTEGYGESQPISDGESAISKERNRRVEISFHQIR